MTRLEKVQEWLPEGWSVDTYSPGDGVTRYRFFDIPDGEYFAHNGTYTALGFKEALTFAKGVWAGFAYIYQRGVRNND